MSIENIPFDVEYLKYKKRIGNLTNKAIGVVKSEKFFPIFSIGEKEYIFKPLSKTKPFTTPMFAYAEVVWSHIINEYFIPCPLYKLAKCKGYTLEVPKYYDYGTIVEKITKENEHLVNLLEFYKENPDEYVNINEYINYCMARYNYVPIFESKVFKNNQKLSEKLAWSVLLSLLKVDQNYHYENVAFLCDENNNILDLAPMIDHEFSSMFLYPDDKVSNIMYMNIFLSNLEDKESVEHQNLIYIIKNFPNITKQFVFGMMKLYKDIEKLYLKDFSFIWNCNSDDYKIGIARYKENNEEKAKIIKKDMKYYPIDLKEQTTIIIKEIKMVVDTLMNVINEYT